MWYSIDCKSFKISHYYFKNLPEWSWLWNTSHLNSCVNLGLSQNGYGYIMLEPKWPWIHMVNTMHTGIYIIHV